MGNDRRSQAILLAVYATFALDCFSTFTSSPQTTEINAEARADTLMKWVKIGAAVAIAGGVVGAYASESPLPLIATAVVAAALWAMYEHAKKAGLDSGAPGTENYGAW